MNSVGSDGATWARVVSRRDKEWRSPNRLFHLRPVFAGLRIADDDRLDNSICAVEIGRGIGDLGLTRSREDREGRRMKRVIEVGK